MHWLAALAVRVWAQVMETTESKEGEVRRLDETQMTKLIATYKECVAKQQALSQIKRKLYKMAGKFTRKELAMIWEEDLREITEAHHRQADNANERINNQLRWKYNAGRDRLYLLSYAKDAKESSYTRQRTNYAKFPVRPDYDRCLSFFMHIRKKNPYACEAMDQAWQEARLAVPTMRQLRVAE